SITNRLASLRIAQYRGIENYAVASTSGDMSMIGRAMSMDNLHQSFYIDVSAGYKKHHEQKSHVTSTGFGYDRIIRNQDGKYLVGALASFGKLSADQNAQNDDGDLYSLTGYVSYERLNTEGWEFLSYLTVGHLNNERSITPEINLGMQEFDEKQWMLMSSNALKYNVPLPSGKFQYAFKPMLLADIGVTHNQDTSSTYFKREGLTDWSVDLGLGLEYAAFSTDASYSLQLTAKRNVYHSEDTVGVNLSHANGFIQYELAKDRAMQFNLNALTSQELTQSLSIDLMAGLGANTE
ncbi:anti-codon nuclease masking agent, partial [gut metagenome]